MAAATSTVIPVGNINLTQDPQSLLADLGKDTRLVHYGGGNFGMPLELQEQDRTADLTVPTERFFMRSNGPVPVIDPETWALTVDGHVDRPLSLTLDDLQRLPQRRLTAFLECAGNGRTRYNPVPEGTPWRNDACGTAVWEGVSLADVLTQAGMKPGAVDLVAQGGDFPEMQRGLPVSVARDPDTLLVLRMNGEPLTVAHGAPVRLLTPGWAGIASTKWLVGLAVLDHAFAGYWNADNYVYWAEDGTALRPVEEMGVKSVIASPQADQRLAAGSHTITGYAWSGYGDIATVEVSTSGGATWQPADLERTGRRAWVRFSLPWVATPGEYTVLARATDERHLRQPVQAAWNLKGYGQNGIHAVVVTVE